MNELSTALFTSVLILAQFGCTEITSESRTDIGDQDLVSSGLPVVSGAGGNCDNTIGPPSFCDWLQGYETLVQVQVISTTMSSSPVIMKDTVMDSCGGEVQPVFDIQARVLRVLAGNLKPSDEIRIKVGTAQLERWNPAPFDAEDGIVWKAAGDLDSAKYSIVPGSSFIAPLVHHPKHDFYNAGISPFLDVHTDGTVRFQGVTGECLKADFPDERYASVDDLETKAAQCPAIPVAGKTLFQSDGYIFPRCYIAP